MNAIPHCPGARDQAQIGNVRHALRLSHDVGIHQTVQENSLAEAEHLVRLGL